MSTPAGWYDDGSGRLRWWDGTQWTEHFAPESAAPAETSAEPATAAPTASGWTDAAAGAEPTAQDAAVPPVESAPGQQYGAPQYGASQYGASQYDASQYDASQYGASQYGAPQYDASQYGAPQPGASQYGYEQQPYGAQTQDSQQPTGKAKPSVLGWIAFGVAVLGLLLSWIPFVGLFLPVVGLVLSVIALFLKGAKWPGIVGVAASVIGLIVSILIVVGIFALAQRSAELSAPDPFPSSHASEETTESTPSESRPTAEEVAGGIQAIAETQGTDSFTEGQLLCFGEEFVASDIPDDVLQVIASGEDTFTDPDAAQAFAEELGNALPTCALR